ncbi:Uncharacterised protein [uncultured archaeon]|nr:Uncharacterised protein [uncultured archaeon]
MRQSPVDLIPRLRWTTVAALALSGGVLYGVLNGYRLQGYATALPLLLAVQILLNDFLELYVLSKAGYNTRWFTLLMAPGTILHELSHLLTALFTGCYVTQARLFQPNPKTGVLGYVSYSQPEDKWAVLRDFAVGLSPFFVCGVAFLLITLIHQPDATLRFLNPNTVESGNPTALITTAITFFNKITSSLTAADIKNPLIWAALYLEFCFALGSAPSSEDLKLSAQSFKAHILSTIFLLILAWATISLTQNPQNLGKIGPPIVSGLFIFLGYALIILIVSIGFHLIAITLSLIGGWIFSIPLPMNLIPPLIAAATYVQLPKISRDAPPAVTAITVLFLTAFLIKNPDLFLKPGKSKKKKTPN